jgi:hypothetical protein
MKTHDRDKVIAAAKEAGNNCDFAVHIPAWDKSTWEFMERFYAIAHEAGRVAEREECAKVCDTDWNGDADTYAYSEAANECAEAIRARSTK